MKKFLSILMAFVMVLSMGAMFVACDNGDATADTNADSQNTQHSQTDTEYTVALIHPDGQTAAVLRLTAEFSGENFVYQQAQTKHSCSNQYCENQIHR